MKTRQTKAYLTTHAQIVAALPGTSQDIIEITGFSLRIVNKYISEMRRDKQAHIKGYEWLPNCARPVAMYANGYGLDAPIIHAPRKPRAKFVSAVDRHEAAAMLSEQRAKERARKDADNARFWKFEPMRYLFAKRIPAGMAA
jgi:hypothetical protein